MWTHDPLSVLLWPNISDEGLCRIFMKFVIRIFTEKKLFLKNDFRENPRSDGRTFCRDVNETLSNSVHFTSDLHIGKCNVDSSSQTDLAVSRIVGQ